MKKLLSALLGIFGLFIVPAYAALPSGYTELEYIESTGTQYIDTGYFFTDIATETVTLDFMRTGTGAGSLLYGTRKAYKDNGYAIQFQDGGNTYMQYGEIDSGIGDSAPGALNTRYTLIQTGPTYSFRDASYTSTGATPTQSYPLYLFTTNNGGNPSALTPMRVYSFVIKDRNNSIKLHLVPAKNSSGVVGMYDTVGNRFYTNAGTGEFIAGDPVTTCDGTMVNYTSATGTVSQAGTPTPDNPIEPVFYTQGDMVLRKVGTYADSYDATTGKITRRVGVKVLDGTEGWQVSESHNFSYLANILYGKVNGASSGNMSTHFPTYTSWTTFDEADVHYAILTQSSNACSIKNTDFENGDVAGFKSWLAQQYAAGTPVTVWYPLETETTEDWPASYCETPIKIATTKYNESAFSPLNTALQNAISVVDSVVSNTITQAASIATLQAQKQTRPDDTCPAYKQCLLVEDENGKPHWYEITDPFRDFVAPIIANNVAPASTTNDAGYTQLEYIRSDGASWIDTGITGTQDTAIETKFINLSSDSSTTVLIGDGWSNTSYLLSIVAQTGAPNRIGGLNNTLRDFWRTGQEFVVKMDKTGLYVNNSKIQWSGSATNFTTTKPLYLLGDPAASGRNSNARLYYMKIYNNGTLVRDFVPVKRNSDSAIGMYDTVSKRFFGNKGTGTFTAGPTVANTDVPANPTWTATWTANATTGVSAGTVYGEGLCNAVTGTASTAATSTQTSSSNWSNSGASCWCRATGVDDGDGVSAANGSWVFFFTFSSVPDCAHDCAANCAGNVLENASFRSALFGM